MKKFKNLQAAVEYLIEKSDFGQNPDFKISEELEDWIADEAGLIRNWNEITEQYTESVTDWLFRIYDFFEYNIFTEVE